MSTTDVENIAESPARNQAARLVAIDRLLRADDDERPALFDALEVEPFEVDEYTGAALAVGDTEALEVHLYRDTADPERTLWQVVTGTGGPHVEWTRQSHDGGSIVVVCYWGRDHHLEVVTVPHLAAALDEMADQI